jgi:hypothetical protein
VVSCLPNTADAGCPLGQLCTTTALGLQCVTGCLLPSDCPAFETCGAFVQGVGQCGAGCKNTADCQSRAYVMGVCLTPTDGGYPTCGCTQDSDCPGCEYCYTSGTCLGALDAGGPVVVGDHGALTMADNLGPAMAFVEQSYPGAELTRIFGGGLADGGTANLLAPGYSSQWQYVFRVGSTTQVALVYNAEARKCATPASSTPGTLPAPLDPEQISSLLPPDQIEAVFESTWGCPGWTAASGDTLEYQAGVDGGATYDLDTSIHGFMEGDALTGTAYVHVCN